MNHTETGNPAESQQVEQLQTPSNPASHLPPLPPFKNRKPDKTSKRQRIVFGMIIGLLLLIITFETAVILEQRRVTQQVEAQSQATYQQFLKRGIPASASNGSNVLLRNVQYCWSKEICIDTNRLSATAVPVNPGSELVFDDLKSFIVKVHNGTVRISPKTLQGMFNESVFNYPGSNLRNLSVSIEQAGQANRIKLAGSLKYFLWIPFEMDTNLKVDSRTNTLVISVYQLKAFGFIPATWLIELKPFNLQKLLPLPENRYLTVRQNLMMVKPFGLFPPPRIDGKMTSIAVLPRMIQLSFSGNEPAISSAGGVNSITVKGGNPQFGRIRMMGADVQVNDRNPGDPFRFSLLNYLNYLPTSQVKLRSNGGATLLMSDHESIPDIGKGLFHPKNDERLKKGKSPGNAWEKTTAKVKNWLKIGN